MPRLSASWGSLSEAAAAAEEQGTCSTRVLDMNSQYTIPRAVVKCDLRREEAEYAVRGDMQREGLH
jgi:hypothetical protein